MLTVRRDVPSQGPLGGPHPDKQAFSSDRAGPSEPPDAGPAVGVRAERRRRRRRRFREMMAVLVVLAVLFAATVVILGLQWLDSPSTSGGSPSAQTSSGQSLTLHVGPVGPTVER